MEDMDIADNTDNPESISSRGYTKQISNRGKAQIHHLWLFGPLRWFDHFISNSKSG